MVENASITLFNKHYDKVSKREVLNATYFDSVSWYAKHGVTISASGQERSYRTIVRICSKDQSGFVESDLYDGAGGTWTLQNGDLVTKGDYRHLTKASEVTALEHTFVIDSWSDNRRGQDMMQHWKIEGA